MLSEVFVWKVLVEIGKSLLERNFRAATGRSLFRKPRSPMRVQTDFEASQRSRHTNGQ